MIFGVIDRPRLKTFKERLPKKQTPLHRSYTARYVLDITISPTFSDLIANVNDWDVEPSANT